MFYLKFLIAIICRLLNFIPLLITVFILHFSHHFSFINCFILFLILNTVNEALKMQFKIGILSSTTSVQRTNLEWKIVNGNATILDRIFYFILQFILILVYRWDFTFSIAIYSGIITYLYKLIF